MKLRNKQSKSQVEAENIRKYAGAVSTIYTRRIRELAVTHHKLCEHECNGHINDNSYGAQAEREMAWVEKRKETVERLITKYAGYCGLTVKFHGDPRGCTVKLYNAKDLELIKPIWDKHCDSSSIGHGVDCW